MGTELDRGEALITVQDLKDRFLWGISLTDDDGNEIPNILLENAILSAISWAEHELDISITPRTYTENRDFNRTDYYDWGYLRLYHYPVLSVTSWKARYPLGTDLINYPTDWIRINNETGELRMVPTAGTISTFFLPGGAILPYVLGKASIPQFFEVIYKAGFEDGEIPYFINKIIGMKASIDALNILGDLIAGAGISSASLGIDGLSQSISTTSSATNSGYGARVIQLEKQIKNDLALARRYYKGIEMVVS